LNITGKTLLQIYIINSSSSSSSSDAYNNKAMGQTAVYEWFRHFQKKKKTTITGG